ncbi:hypothetical protein UFOVP255_17 [uncultured Caudovirales phage]|uniref:Uncharacterized protein n=1 Tax=uncultured Caudovirales phage TaxID=2100421 RepID=A0A6J5LE47_9CAUD|nr:hypothetical protein UFOVP255_17 [uncultured Caudovirales phage]
MSQDPSKSPSLNEPEPFPVMIKAIAVFLVCAVVCAVLVAVYEIYKIFK